MSDGAFHIGGYEHELDFEIPVSVCDIEESLAGWPFRKPREEPEPSEAMRLLGRPIYRETRKRDMAEIRRIHNMRRDDDC